MSQKGFHFFCVFALITHAGVAAAQDAGWCPSIAVADIAVSPGGYTLAPPQLGPVIVDLLVNELTSSRQFHVYDGQWLVPGPERGGRVDLDRLRSAAEEQHVDYLVLGTVTSFSVERGGRSGGALLPKPFPVVGGLARRQARLALDLSLRIVDVRTGEIVSAAYASGTATRKSRGFALGGLLHGLPLGVAAAANVVDAGTARDAMLNEAVQRAVHTAAAALTTRHLIPGR
jgi:curli biogenesis system outer membrane secretion channel CsgG